MQSRSLYEQQTFEILESISDAFYALDANFCFAYVNRKAEQLWGRERREDLIGLNLWSVFPQSVGSEAHRMHLLAMNERRSVHFETFSHMLDAWVEISIYPAATGGLSVYFRDVTHRHKAEEALRESEANLRAITDATPASIVISRRSDGTLLYANPFARQLFGVGNDADLTPYVSADFYQDPEGRAEVVRQLAENDVLEVQETAFKRLDGTPFWCEGSFRRMVYQGEDAVLAAHHDITLRKKVEAEREQALQEALERADRDPLTNLLNHRAFYERLRAEVAHAERAGGTVALVVLDLDNFKFFNEAYGHLGGDEVLAQVADALRSTCRGHDVVARLGGDEFALLTRDARGEEDARRMAERARAQVERIGFTPPQEPASIPLGFSFGIAVYPDDASTAVEIAAVADQRLMAAKRGENLDRPTATFREGLERNVEGFSMLSALVTAVDNKDRYTRKHSEEVLVLCLMIAEQLGTLSDEEQDSLCVAALLHDVGKVAVPDRLLRLPAPLSSAEYEEMKQHAVMGAAIIGAVPGLEHTLPAVRHHHEAWNGSGYPHGLAGEKIPLAARILAVADAFSAMTTNRPYRRGMPRSQALAILQAGAGKQWDSRCVEALVTVLTDIDDETPAINGAKSL